MAQTGCDQGNMRDEFKIQVVRSIGVAIVKHGNMYPSMEILLRHAVQWLGMKSSKAVQKPGVLDNEKLFIEEMQNLHDNEMVAVLSIHMLTIILDGAHFLHFIPEFPAGSYIKMVSTTKCIKLIGGLNEKEHEMLERVFGAVPDKVGQYDRVRIEWTASQ